MLINCLAEGTFAEYFYFKGKRKHLETFLTCLVTSLQHNMQKKFCQTHLHRLRSNIIIVESL